MRTLLFVLCISVISCSQAEQEKAKNESHEFKVLTKGEVVDLIPHVSADAYTVFDFYADWCPPCIKLNKSLVDLKGVYGDKVEIYKLDIVNWDSELAKHFEIKDLPYLIVYNKGELMKKGPSNQVLPDLIRGLNQN